ncbi:arylsulfatase I-like isoform X2 [Thalassophryne amazonica]|uniref:arylsulfatase I-like isoform X2 n=1 Tax=Thalassophryne amazonica TaxID=390379 RepID=UPI001471A6F7|nr:arylsulfatase I-like isoform X2 [Thalassophryne amazonica]
MQASAVAAALSVLGVLLSLECTVSHQPKDGEEKTRPHIIFILTDDQGYNDIGYHNPTIKTPTLDKLAAEGVKLENYYVQPICTPSRSQLITGRYQIHTGLQHSIIRPRQPSCLPSHMDTLPERLRQAGYTTHMVGKWHLGFYRKVCLPTRKGFDSFFGSLTGSVDYYNYESCDGPGLCGYDLHDDESVAWGQEGKYSTLLFTQRARKILESHDPAARPMFLLLSLQAVHTPLQPPKSYIYPYRHMANVARRKYAAMVSTVDEAVRNITYAVRKYGYYRNSVIIYSTDNGAQPFTGGSNWPLRGRKGTYWEGGVRGVAFVHSPLLRRRRRISKALLHITDWFPTLVGLAGGNNSQSRGLDGFDVWPTISEGAESPRQEILHNIDPLHKPLASATVRETSKKKVTRTAPGASARGSGSGPKKPKKKRQQKEKLVFKAKTTKKPWTFSHHAPKSKPVPKSKMKLLIKSKLKPQMNSQYRKRLKSYFRGAPFTHQGPVSGTRSPKFHVRIQSPLEPKSRQISSQYQDLPQSRARQPMSQVTLSVTSPPTPSVWDTSVQAAIRVGDWKLLTGDPGHGDWVPPQVLPTLPGRWWNLERGFSTLYKTPAHKNVWLFNITDDPCERRDLADQRPDVVQQLLARLAHYNQTAVPVYFPPDDPQANPSRHGGAWVPWANGGKDEEVKYHGVYKKSKNNKKKKKKCRLCKLKSFFLKLNTGMMSNRI